MIRWVETGNDRILVGKPHRKQVLGKLRRRLDDNKMNSGEIICEDVRWMELAQYHVKWWALIWVDSTIRKLIWFSLSHKAWNILSYSVLHISIQKCPPPAVYTHAKRPCVIKSYCKGVSLFHIKKWHLSWNCHMLWPGKICKRIFLCIVQHKKLHP